MAAFDTRQELIEAYLLTMISRNAFSPYTSLEDACLQFNLDTAAISALSDTRYINGRDHRVPKAGNMHLAWEYAQDPRDYHRFLNMLRIPPLSFRVLLSLIENHEVFRNDSQTSQAAVEEQLAVTLFRMGRYGNGASVEDVARHAGISVGSVENYTARCLTAIESLHDLYVRPLTPEEKEIEKLWLEGQLGFRGMWREGWIMYDGTIVVLYRCPGMDGDTYFTRKGNYGLNVQIGNIPTNLRIADYSLGMTGAAHDAEAFKHTGAAKFPDWFFEGDEFAWVDSAYPCTNRTIPVHKEPASRIPENTIFDKYVSHLRVRSEHCMGALKGRFQCLRGLRVHINSKTDHGEACRWVKCAIILHNLVIDVEGEHSAHYFRDLHTRVEEHEDRGDQTAEETVIGGGEEKRKILIAELLRYRDIRDGRVM